jgi:hypothetical protein
VSPDRGMTGVRWRLALAVVGPLALVWGCGKPVDPSLVPVTGTATVDGQPLTNATVTFIPKDGTPGFGGSGKTDSSGTFRLTGSRDNAPGIPPGEYRVAISKRLMPDGSEVPANDNTPPMNSPAKECLPVGYSNPATTQLTATVKPGAGPIDFPLRAKTK